MRNKAYESVPSWLADTLVGETDGKPIIAMKEGKEHNGLGSGRFLVRVGGQGGLRREHLIGTWVLGRGWSCVDPEGEEVAKQQHVPRPWGRDFILGLVTGRRPVWLESERVVGGEEGAASRGHAGPLRELECVTLWWTPWRLSGSINILEQEPGFHRPPLKVSVGRTQGGPWTQMGKQLHLNYYCPLTKNKVFPSIMSTGNRPSVALGPCH